MAEDLYRKALDQAQGQNAAAGQGGSVYRQALQAIQGGTDLETIRIKDPNASRKDILSFVGSSSAQPAQPETATYIGNNGERQTGVVAPTSAPAAGATAPATPAAEAAGATPTHWDTMRGLYQQMYDDQVAANNTARAEAERRAAEATQAQLEAMRSGYRDTNRQLYRDYMEREKLLPQQMAAAGYTGGLAESSRVRLANSYGEGLNENARAQMGAENEANAALAQRLYEAQATAAAANNAANQQRLGYLLDMEGRQYTAQQDRAAMLASAGDFSGYAALGYTQEELDYLARYWLSQQNDKTRNAWITGHPEDAKRLGVKISSSGASGSSGTSGGRSGGRSGGSDETETGEASVSVYRAAIEAARQAGETTAQIINMIQAERNAGNISDSTARQLIVEQPGGNGGR